MDCMEVLKNVVYVCKCLQKIENSAQLVIARTLAVKKYFRTDFLVKSRAGTRIDAMVEMGNIIEDFLGKSIGMAE